ncbi:MAG: DUF5106 domain-containing protein [Bacteroidales bacterium]|nr:DUF5106 domain-containing protein [Bacteroidales bacterium]
MKKIMLFFFAAFLGFPGMTQTNKGFEMTVKIDGYPEGARLSLGRYYADKHLFVDTAIFDKKRGVYVFKRPERLEGGMYMLISFENMPADLIIDQYQQFSIEMNYPFNATNVSTMKFKNSPENQIYMELNAKVRPFFEELSDVRKEFEALEDKQSPEAEALAKRQQSIWENMEKARTQFMQDNPKHLMTAVWRAQRDIEVPEAPDDIPEDERNHWRYNYFKDHYFDNMDLTDDRLIRTPVFHQRLETYIDKVLSQHHDSIKFALERLIEQTREAPELFKYVVWYSVDRYQRSQIVGYDAIWIYLAKKYYLGGDAFWASDAVIENFRKHIERWEPLLIGNRPPEFMCPDTNVGRPEERWRSVFEPQTRYTVVMFWEPSCGHCKRQMPLLRDFYNAKREELDFEVFAVCRHADIDLWKNYIYSNHMTDWINVYGMTSNIKYDDLWDVSSIPTIYVLDSQKRIVTKRIEVDQIEPFIRNWNALYYDGK